MRFYLENELAVWGKGSISVAMVFFTGGGMVKELT